MKKKSNNGKINFLKVQKFLTILLVIAFIMYLFNRKMWIILQFLLGITLIMMSLSNYLIVKRKYFTLIYFLVGLSVIIYNILVLVGVL